MIYGVFPLEDAEGLILGHSLALPDCRLSKGHALSLQDIAALRQAGLKTVTGARLASGDVPENMAAERLAALLAAAHLDRRAAFTGRVNIHAQADGLLLVDREGVTGFNLIDEGISLATLPSHSAVSKGQLVASLKVIPYALPGSVLDQAAGMSADRPPLLHLAPFRPHDAGLIQTRIAGQKPSLFDKTERTTRDRLGRLGGALAFTDLVPHETAALAAAMQRQKAQGAAPILVMGSAATVDAADIVPAALIAAGGQVERFGMPVDPGNLLLFGHLGETPVIGLPGCARSRKLNGFDWVMQRVFAGLDISARDWAGMGVGGLLKEIPSRPQPREKPPSPPRPPRVEAVLLAAGLSSRMTGRHKLLAEINGRPLIRHSVMALLDSDIKRLIVVLGHEAKAIRPLLDDLDIEIVETPDYARGMSHSLRAGLSRVSPEAAGVMVALADMPNLKYPHINKLIAAFAPEDGRAICRPVHDGKPGHPVLWARRFLPEIEKTEGDQGPRAVIAAHIGALYELPFDDPAILTDIDDEAALLAARKLRNRD